MDTEQKFHSDKNVSPTATQFWVKFLQGIIFICVSRLTGGLAIMSATANPVFVGPTSVQTPECKVVKNVTNTTPTKDGELSSRIILMRSDYFWGFLINIITIQNDICLEINPVLITINYIDYKTQSNGFRR